MIEYQRIILADTIRNEAFAKALRKVIRKGTSTVSDIGSGTGFLSFLASSLGAKECYLYEQSELLELSRALAKANGIRHCHFVQSHSDDVARPVKTDIVLSETLGNIALEEGIIETMNDAKRFLKTGGTVIPSQLQQYVAPVVTDRLFQEVTSWDRIGYNLQFPAARELSVNNVYVRTVRPADLWQGKDAAKLWDQIDFTKGNNRPVRTATTTWKPAVITPIYGFVLWWSAELLPGIELSTSPFAPATHWEQIFLPVREPLTIEPGDTLSLDLCIDSHREVRINVAWTVTQQRHGAAIHHQSMDMQNGIIG